MFLIPFYRVQSKSLRICSRYVAGSIFFLAFMKYLLFLPRQILHFYLLNFVLTVKKTAVKRSFFCRNIKKLVAEKIFCVYLPKEKTLK